MDRELQIIKLNYVFFTILSPPRVLMVFDQMQQLTSVVNFGWNKNIKGGEELDPKLNPTNKNCFEYFSIWFIFPFP